MVKLITALGMFMVCAFGPVGAHAASDGSRVPSGDYAPPVPTTVTIEVDAKIQVGRNVKARVDVKANTDGRLSGTLRVSLNAKAKGVVPASAAPQTHRFSGTPVVADFGPLARGSYEVEATFTPDDPSLYSSSSSARSFEVVPARAVDGTSTGVLPNTGGPSHWWLLLALLLVASGAGAVTYARSRSVAG